MIANGFQLDAFIRNAEAIARVVGAGELFSLLSRTVSLPPSCAALVWRESSQPTFVPCGRAIAADGAREVFFVKTLPFQIDYKIAGLSSKDGYDFSATVSLSVQAVPERAELEQLRRELLGSGHRGDAGDLRRHCASAVRAALAAFAQDRDAELLADPQCASQFDAVLVEHFQPLGFASGLALGRDIRVAFDSPGFAEFRRARDEQKRKKQRLEAEEQLHAVARQARDRHLEELAELLERVRATADKNPALSVAELVKSFDVARRGELYRGLLALGSQRRNTQFIVVVAGQELLWFDPGRAEKPLRRVAVSDELGPLRSVRVARRADSTLLLVGARYGLHVLDAAGDSRQAYPFPDRPEIRGGVNAAALVADRFYATHSEVGLTGWELGKPSTPATCLQQWTKGCTSVRDVQIDGAERIWFAADARVIGWSPASGGDPIVLAAPASIQSLAVGEGQIHAGLDDGGIVRWQAAEPHDMDLIRPPGGEPVHSLEWMSGGGVPRLLIADKRPRLTLMVLGDTYHADYSWTQPLRWAFAADDWILGVSDARDQLVLWRADLPEEPAATIHIGRLCGHSIQDVAMLSATEPAGLVIG